MHIFDTRPIHKNNIRMWQLERSFLEKPQVDLDKIHVCLFSFFLLFSVIHTRSRESNWKALHSCVESARRRPMRVTEKGEKKRNIICCDVKTNKIIFGYFLGTLFPCPPTHSPTLSRTRRVRLPRRIL